MQRPGIEITVDSGGDQGHYSFQQGNQGEELALFVVFDQTTEETTVAGTDEPVEHIGYCNQGFELKKRAGNVRMTK